MLSEDSITKISLLIACILVLVLWVSGIAKIKRLATELEHTKIVLSSTKAALDYERAENLLFKPYKEICK